MRQKNFHIYCTWYKSLSVGYNPPYSLHVIRIQEFPIEWASKHFFQVYFGPIFGLTTMQCGFIEVYNHNHPTICHIVSFSPNCSFTLSDGMAHSGAKLKKIRQKFVKLIDHKNAFGNLDKFGIWSEEWNDWNGNHVNLQKRFRRVSWNHFRWTYFWRVLAIWNYCAAAHTQGSRNYYASEP